MLGGLKKKNVASSVPILAKYLQDHHIPVISAKAQTSKFLNKHFGDRAETILNSRCYDATKGNRWMWKYTSFVSIINEFEDNTGMQCNRVISIGDGIDEEKAARKWCKNNSIDSLHIRLLRGPTINQMVHEWKYIKQNLFSKIIKKGKINGEQIYKDSPAFYISDFRKLDEFDCDNTRQFTGKTHQLSDIAKYFQLWMDFAQRDPAETASAMEFVSSSIYRKMNSLNAGSDCKNFKIILVKAICKNKTFNGFFKSYRQTRLQSEQANEGTLGCQ
jgi:hypothetical protein